MFHVFIASSQNHTPFEFCVRDAGRQLLCIVPDNITTDSFWFWLVQDMSCYFSLQFTFWHPSKNRYNIRCCYSS